MAIKTVFRVDASIEIGTGHAVRSLALASALRAQGADTLIVARHMTDALKTQILQAGHDFRMLTYEITGKNLDSLPHSHWVGAPQSLDGEVTLEAIGTDGCEWLVVDHYGLDASWEREMKRAAKHVLVIDDLADREHACEILVDQNMQPAGSDRYRGLVPSSCKLLLGPRFALLRPEFRNASSGRERSGSVSRINVFFGGIDAPGMTLRTLNALGRMSLPGVEVDIVVGGGNPQLAQIRDKCSRAPGVHLHVQIREMAALVAAADVAIGAGGSASWERCCLGLPSIVVSIAENQLSGCFAMAEAGAAIYLGDALDLSEEQLIDAITQALADPDGLRAMGKHAVSLVDGRGMERVMLSMMRDKIELRHAVCEDAARAWGWRNNPDTRRYFNDPSFVASDTHQKWWEAALADTSREMLMASCAGIDCAVIRFDCVSNVATISIYVDPELTGLGLGSRVLQAGCDWIEDKRPGVTLLQAEVRSENQASQNAFAAVGFTHDTSTLWTRGVGAAR